MDRRKFFKYGTSVLPIAGTFPAAALSLIGTHTARPSLACRSAYGFDEKPDYTLRIKNGLLETGHQQIISTTLYNGQFPGPLLRFKEGQRSVVDIYNDSDRPEQFHWHGQFLPVEVDGAAEERTPFIPPHGMRREILIPQPSGFRFYHTHVIAGADLGAGQYSGLVGPVYIEPKNNPGAYDREEFIVLKEFDPYFMRGGDMAMDFLAGKVIAELKAMQDKAEKELKGVPKGYEVGYKIFTVNGRKLGHGQPIRVKQGERVLFHILNGSATETRSLALPGHHFKVLALDGNAVPVSSEVPVLWLGTAERISAIVEMNNPGVWIMGDLADDDRGNGMGIVVEYSNHRGKPLWIKPKPFTWDYTLFGKHPAQTPQADETIEMVFAKQQAAENGFNRWTINGTAFDMMTMPTSFHLKKGRRYRLKMRNGSDDIHPMHFHRHSFELIKIAGKSTGGIIKDVAMLGGFQEMEVDFIANNPGLSLFHCHMQLHMDFGFMALFDYI
jgi:FtsP/CotA-like multicopper oxidase with cupredoxin domain